MKNMFLAIDIGNTSIVFGVFKNNEVIFEHKTSSKIEKSREKIDSIINKFNKIHQIPFSEFYGCGISSVVPKLTKPISSSIRKYYKLIPLNIDNNLKLEIDISNVDAPALGADRICVSVAAFAKYGGPVIILDLGTATTFDIISQKGRYLGGIIMPGLELSATSLHQKTAKLPKIDLKFPKSIIGKNTISNLESGIMYGALYSIEGFIKQIKNELGTLPYVVATGGLAGVIAAKTGFINDLQPNLVLDGIKMIYDRNHEE
jgi:type III pantothenate kinase